MSAFECYKEYVALKKHFTTPSYDYFKYNGKINISYNTFEKRKDKLFFQKLAKHTDLKNFLIANFANDERSWIRNLAYNEEAEKIYKDWLKKNQSLTYVFKEDIKKLNDDFNSNFVCQENQHPILFKKFLGKEICLETLCLLLEFSNAMKHWNSKMEYDLVWETFRNKIEKYAPFIKCDKDKLRKICVEHFTK
jgi:hypothetical protein